MYIYNYKTFIKLFLTLFSRYNSDLLHYIRKISYKLLYVESIESVLKLSHGFNWMDEALRLFLLKILFINIFFSMCVAYNALSRIALQSDYHRFYV